MRIDCRTVEAIEPGKLYSHANVVYVDTDYEGCCDKYRCEHCGTTYWVEAPA